jgi:hypothetical protein
MLLERSWHGLHHYFNKNAHLYPNVKLASGLYLFGGGDFYKIADRYNGSAFLFYTLSFVIVRPLEILRSSPLMTKTIMELMPRGWELSVTLDTTPVKVDFVYTDVVNRKRSRWRVDRTGEYEIHPNGVLMSRNAIVTYIPDEVTDVS